MAGRKNTRSSKTDHVLSLLSNPPQDRAQQEETPKEQPSSPSPAGVKPAAPCAEKPAAVPPEAAAAAPAGGPREPRLSPPILEVARANNEALEEAIHTALENALLEELSQSPEPEAAQGPESVQEPQPAQEPQPVQEPQSEPQPTHVPDPGENDITLPDGSRFTNVMLILVEEKLERYVKLFHLCSCPRCVADAKALALSRLPAKYVVLPGTAYPPMMNLYRAKYDSMVTAQVVYACKQILDAPRHQMTVHL